MTDWKKPCAGRDAFLSGAPTYIGRVCQRCGSNERITRAMKCANCEHQRRLQRAREIVVADLKRQRERVAETHDALARVYGYWGRT